MMVREYGETNPHGSGATPSLIRSWGISKKSTWCFEPRRSAKAKLRLLDRGALGSQSGCDATQPPQAGQPLAVNRGGMDAQPNPGPWFVLDNEGVSAQMSALFCREWGPPEGNHISRVRLGTEARLREFADGGPWHQPVPRCPAGPKELRPGMDGTIPILGMPAREPQIWVPFWPRRAAKGVVV